MRFLLSSLLALSSLSVVHCIDNGCVPKTDSGSSHCQVQTSSITQILQTGAGVITIPSFDVATAGANAVLDAIWINTIDADYAGTGTYSVTGQPGDQLSGFSISINVPALWGLYSSVDNNNLDLSLALGGFSVNTAFATILNPRPCFDEVDPFGTHTGCRNSNLIQRPFTMIDNTYALTTLAQTDGIKPFRPNFTETGTATAFQGPISNTATSGFSFVVNPSANYKSTFQPAWQLRTNNGETPSDLKVTSSFSVQGGAGGGAVNVQITQSLNVQIQVQYDYHIPSVTGDPQFSGFQGQSFQVHGAPESYFALISASNYYVNARFDYLSTGKCDYNETACFTHPGTYMGLIYVGMKDGNILVQAGPHSTGFAGILINDKPMQVGERFSIPSLSGNSHIHMISKSKVNLVLDTITLTIYNSDLFVNFDLGLSDKQLLNTGSEQHVIPSGATSSQIAHHLNKWYGSYNPLHGLIGQTWRNVKYNDGKLYQGDITEYQVDKIVDHTFLYCVYQP